MGIGPRDTEVDERLWEMYLQDCRDHGVKSSLKDYLVWREEQEYDIDEPEYY